MTCRCTAFKKSASFFCPILIFPSNLNEAVERCDAVLTPLPVTKDQITVFAPFATNEIYLDEVLSLMENKPFLCGMASEELKKSARKWGAHLIDYFESEYLTVSNCVPTTEGAVSIAIENTPFTIFRLKCFGFGVRQSGTPSFEKRFRRSAPIPMLRRAKRQTLLGLTRSATKKFRLQNLITVYKKI
ncbi:MAG: hypothetical protein L6V93_22435 [Clostridiales bacterium]|nr:MAG: hypothetical protein L6V93_22435 [Clostridiales bacterium]